MNTVFNSALKQSTSIRKDLAALSSLAQKHTESPNPAFHPSAQGKMLTPSILGALTASITAFSRTVDEYATLTKQEPNPAKAEKAAERLRSFRTDLSGFRSELESLKSASAELDRTDLLGRRPFATDTLENPYTNATRRYQGVAGGGSAYSYQGSTSSSQVVAGSYGLNDQTAIGGNAAGEGHALQEQAFFASTNSALDEYIARGQAVLGDLGQQREILKSTQKKLYSVGNTLGISGDTIRMIERRARQDKWIFWGGLLVFVLFCWVVLHYVG